MEDLENDFLKKKKIFSIFLFLGSAPQVHCRGQFREKHYIR